MTTIVNAPGNGDNGSSGLIVGIIVAVVVIILFFLYALPAIRGNNPPANDGGRVDVNVQLPTGSNDGAAPASSN